MMLSSLVCLKNTLFLSFLIKISNKFVNLTIASFNASVGAETKGEIYEKITIRGIMSVTALEASTAADTIFNQNSLSIS